MTKKRLLYLTLIIATLTIGVVIGTIVSGGVKAAGQKAKAPDRSERVRNLGTGFIVDKAGFILTNHHVVDKATKIMVRLEDKSEFQAKLIGSDADTDLAVVKIEAGRDLPVLKLGNSDSVKVGDWVLAIGSPFSLDHTVTHGIITAKARTKIGGARKDFQSFLQTDP